MKRTRPPIKTNGFSFMELMIVLAIISIITPALYRLYHEGVLKRHTSYIKKSAIIRDARLTFNYLQQDLEQASELLSRFGPYRSNSDTLIMKTLAERTRHRLLTQKGNLIQAMAQQEDDCVIVYHENDSREIVRDVYYGRVQSRPSALKNTFKKHTYGLASDRRNYEKAVYHVDRYATMALMGQLKKINFSYNDEKVSFVSRIEVTLESQADVDSAWPIGALSALLSRR